MIDNQFVIERCSVLKDVSREEASKVTRTGQLVAVALLALAGGVIAIGGRLLAPGPEPVAAAVEPLKVESASTEIDLPAVLTKRAESISRNLAQLANAPKPPPPPPPPEEEGSAGELPVTPAPVASDIAIAYLGMFGSSARPMALVSIDARQHIVAQGDSVSHNSESIKIAKVERDKIEIERKVGNKTIELAPRTTTSYTALTGASPAPSPVPHNTMPVSPSGRRPNSETMRAPGMGRPRPVPDAIGGAPGSGQVTDEGVPQR